VFFFPASTICLVETGMQNLKELCHSLLLDTVDIVQLLFYFIFFEVNAAYCLMLEETVFYIYKFL